MDDRANGQMIDTTWPICSIILTHEDFLTTVHAKECVCVFDRWKPFFPRMNGIILLLIIIQLVLIDWWVVPRFAEKHVSASPNFRIPTLFQYAQVKAYVDLINADPSPKVILAGDSIIQGGGVKRGDDTISAFLQHKLKQAGYSHHVYNVGLSGSTPADSFFVLKSLKLAPGDVVIYDLNVGHYGGKTIKFPDITAALAAKEHNGKPLYEILHMQDKDKWEDRLQLWVSQTWKLYAYRQLIKDDLLDKKPKNAHVSYAPWYETDWTARTKGAKKRGDYIIQENDDSVTFTRYLIQTARNRGAQVVIFNTPLNQEMMSKYDMINRKQFDQNIQLLKSIIEKEQGLFLDYEKLVPSQHFTDSLHPMREGNRLIAERLFTDIQDLFQRKEE